MNGTANLHYGSEPTNHSRYATDFTLASRDSNLASRSSQARFRYESDNTFTVRPVEQPRLAENGLQEAQHIHCNSRLEPGTNLASSAAQAGQPIGQRLQREQSRQKYHGRSHRLYQKFYHNRPAHKWRESLPAQQSANAHFQENYYHNRIAGHTPASGDAQFQGGDYHRRIPAHAQSQPTAQYVNPSVLSAPAAAYTSPAVPNPLSMDSQSMNVDDHRDYYNARAPPR